MRGSARVWIDGATAVSGRVAAIVQDGAKPTLFRITVAGGAGTPEGGVVVGVELPEGLGVPVQIGDAVSARASTRIEGIHPVTDALLTDGDGRLLVACSGSDDPAFAPGFEVSVGEPARPPREGRGGLASDTSHRVVFRSRGAEAAAADNGWSTMTVDGRSYAVSGLAVRWEPGKPVPPGAKDYAQWAIVQVVAAPRRARRVPGAHVGGIPGNWPALIDARWDDAAAAAACVAQELGEVDPAGAIALELWELVTGWSEALAILGPDEAAPYAVLAGQRDRVVAALPEIEADKGPDRALLLVTSLALLHTLDAPVPPEVDRVARAAVARVAKAPSRTDKEDIEALCAALATGAPEIVAEITGAPLETTVQPGATFGFSASGFARYVASAIRAGTAPEHVRPALLSFVQGFPHRFETGSFTFRALALAVIGFARFVEKTDARGLRRLFDELFVDATVSSDLPRRALLPHELAEDLAGAGGAGGGPASWDAMAEPFAGEGARDVFSALLDRTNRAKNGPDSAGANLWIGVEEIARWCAIKGPAGATETWRVFAGTGWPAKAVEAMFTLDTASDREIFGLLAYNVVSEFVGIKPPPPLVKVERLWVEAGARAAGRGEPAMREVAAWAALYVGATDLAEALISDRTDDASLETLRLMIATARSSLPPQTGTVALAKWVESLPPELYAGSPRWASLVFAIGAYLRWVKSSPVAEGGAFLHVLARRGAATRPEPAANAPAPGPSTAAASGGVEPPAETSTAIAMPPDSALAALCRLILSDQRVQTVRMLDLDAEGPGLAVHIAADGSAWVRFVDRLKTERRHHLPADPARSERLRAVANPAALAKVRPPFRLPRPSDPTERAVALAIFTARGMESARKCTGDRDATFDVLEAFVRDVVAIAAAQPASRAVPYDEHWQPPWTFT